MVSLCLGQKDILYQFGLVQRLARTHQARMWGKRHKCLGHRVKGKMISGLGTKRNEILKGRFSGSLGPASSITTTPIALCEHSSNRPPKPFVMKLQQFERILSKELR